MSLVSDRRDDDVGVDGLEVFGVWWKVTEGGAEYDGLGTITGRKRVLKAGQEYAGERAGGWLSKCHGMWTMRKTEGGASRGRAAPGLGRGEEALEDAGHW